MNKTLGLLLALALLASTSVSAQITVTDTHEGGKPVPKPAPSNMNSATQVQKGSRQAPLRNQDVIQMVKNGQHQAAILSTLRSRGGNFDLSPQGCLALRGANVSQATLNAMGGSNRSQCTSSLPTQKASQNQQTVNGGMLLGNQNATLLGNGSGGQATATALPSNGGDPAALQPQVQSQHSGKASMQPTQSKSAKRVPSTGGTPSAQPQ